MNSFEEIEAEPPLRENCQRVYHDSYGVLTSANLIAEANEAFLALDLQES